MRKSEASGDARGDGGCMVDARPKAGDPEGMPDACECDALIKVDAMTDSECLVDSAGAAAGALLVIVAAVDADGSIRATTGALT